MLSVDLGFALKALRRNLAFSGLVVLCLAAGIGLNTCTFALLNAIFLRPLSVPSPARLMAILTVDPSTGTYLPLSYPNYRDITEQGADFSGMAAFQATTVHLGSPGHTEAASAQIVSGNFFSVLGVNPALGRNFAPEEDHIPDLHPVAILSSDLWKRRFGGGPAILGQEILVNSQRFTVIGVMPASFRGTSKLQVTDLWVPLMMYRNLLPMAAHLKDRDWLTLRCVGRLKPGIAIARARSDLAAIFQRLVHEYPKENSDQAVGLLPFTYETVGPNSRPLLLRRALLIATIVLFLLLSSCANVASILLSRIAVRAREMAIRTTLGASRQVLCRQLVTEYLFLAIAGGAAGFLLSLIILPLLLHSNLFPISLAAVDPHIDLQVLLAAAAFSLVSLVLFGLLPALKLSTVNLGLLTAAASHQVVGRPPRGLRYGDLIVFVQTLSSTLALICASWFALSLYNVSRNPPGVNLSGLSMLSLDLSSLHLGPSEKSKLAERIVTQVSASPGVGAAAIADRALFSPFGFSHSASPGRRAHLPPTIPILAANSVTSEYFQTLGMPLVAGRPFTLHDGETSTRVAIVNERTARQLWPGQDAVGRELFLDDETSPLLVVGVVADSRTLNLTEEPKPQIYFSLLQQEPASFNLYVRARNASSPAGLHPQLRKLLQAIDPNLYTGFKIVAQLRDAALQETRDNLFALATFSLVGLALATLGVYGLTVRDLSDRRSEIHMRLALGAGRYHLCLLLIRRSMTAVLLGLALGIPCALLLGNRIQGVLFQVSTTSPPTFVVTVVALASAMAAAASFPLTTLLLPYRSRSGRAYL
jgi:predicted permease